MNQSKPTDADADGDDIRQILESRDNIFNNKIRLCLYEFLKQSNVSYLVAEGATLIRILKAIDQLQAEDVNHTLDFFLSPQNRKCMLWPQLMGNDTVNLIICEVPSIVLWEDCQRKLQEINRKLGASHQKKIIFVTYKRPLMVYLVNGSGGGRAMLLQVDEVDRSVTKINADGALELLADGGQANTALESGHENPESKLQIPMPQLPQSNASNVVRNANMGYMIPMTPMGQVVGINQMSNNNYNTNEQMLETENIHNIKMDNINNENIDQVDEEGQTFLHIAASIGDTSKVLDLLARGANINALKKFDSTPLQKALWHGQADTAKILVDKNADLNLIDYPHYTALDNAFKRCPSMVEYLKSRGAKTGAELLETKIDSQKNMLE